MAARVTDFVERSSVPVDRLEIGGGRRYVHHIERRNVESLIAADVEVDACRLDERLNARLDHAGRRRWRDGLDLLGQSFALRRVEHGEAFQEGDSVGFLAGVARTLFLVVGDEAVGIDDSRAAFALADISAKGKGLAESEPGLSGKAVLDDGTPEDENIDAAVAAAGAGVSRQSERCFRCRRAPGLHPGNTSGLQLGDDLVGDFVVKVCPIRSGTVISGHRGSPRRAPEASLPALNPSRKTRPALSL